MRPQIEEFLKYLVEEKDCTPNTIAAYRNDLTQFVDFLERQRTSAGDEIAGWHALDTHIIQSYLLYLNEQDYASSTVARKFAAVKSFCAYLLTQGLIESDPTKAFSSPKVKKAVPHTIEPAEVELLLNAPARSNSPKALRDKALMETLYATGMRVTELVSLNMADVAPPYEAIACGETERRRRSVPIYDQAQAALKGYLEQGRPQLLVDESEPALFLNHRGQRLTRQGLWLIIKRYVEQSGIEASVTPHTLRHSFAAHLIDSGAGLREVQKRLGHASLSTTQVYQHAADGFAADQDGTLIVDGKPLSAASG